MRSSPALSDPSTMTKRGPSRYDHVVKDMSRGEVEGHKNRLLTASMFL